MQAVIKYRSSSVTVTVTGVTDRPIIGTVYKDCTLGRQFEAITDADQRQEIAAACKRAFTEIEDVTIDLMSGGVISSGFVARETVKPSVPRPSVKASRNRVSKAQAWDNLNNEGGEGYNPYRR